MSENSSLRGYEVTEAISFIKPATPSLRGASEANDEAIYIKIVRLACSVSSPDLIGGSHQK